MYNLHRLALLDELDRRGTLAAVAQALSFAPSSVSEQLTQLEREVGVRLLEPVGRGVRLTADAHLLLRFARVALAELEAAESALAAARDRVAGVLRVATFQTVALSVQPAVLTDLAGRHPELRVDVAQVQAAEATSGLQVGDFDVVLGEEYPGRPVPPSDRLHREDLRGDRLRLATPEHGPWSTATGLRGVAAAAWALDPEGTAPGDWSRDVCRSAGFEPEVRFDGVDLITHVHLVRTGHAVAILPDLLGAENSRGVRLVELPGRPERMLFTLTRAARVAHPAVTAFRAALTRALAVREDGSGSTSVL